jgi:hypothetical protein
MSPDCASHVAQAEHHDAFRVTIDRDKYSDWSVIASFYEALQYLDAVLAVFGIHSVDNHKARFSAIEKLSRNDKTVHWRQASRDYSELFELSVKARYECLPLHGADLVETEKHLQAVRQWAQDVLNHKGFIKRY